MSQIIELTKINIMKKRTTDIPPILQPLINRVKTFPLNKELPKVKDDAYNFELKAIEQIESLSFFDLRRILQESLESLAEEHNDLLEHIWGKGLIPKLKVVEEIEILCSVFTDSFEDAERYMRIWADIMPDEELNSISNDILIFKKNTRQAAIRYLEFRQLWNQFKILTQVVDKILKEGNSVNENEINIMLNEIPVASRFKYHKVSKRVSYTSDQFPEIIRDCDFTKIRECKWCQKVFWAGRNDQNVCSSSEQENKTSQNDQNFYDCGYFYNLKNFHIRKKLKKKEEWLEKLQEEYKNKKVWAWGIKFNYNDSKPTLPNEKELNGIPIKITDILINNLQAKTTYKFIATELNSKRNGFIEFKYNSRLKDNLDRVFELK